jgi:hypothetical protein
VRHGREYLVAEITLKSGHHGKCDDRRGHTDDHTGYGDEGVKGNGPVSLFGLEIAETDEYFVGKFHIRISWKRTENRRQTTKDLEFRFRL